MAYFAQIDSNGIVLQVIVAEQDFIDSGAVGAPSGWVETSYNTRGGIHQEGGEALRKNYAAPGYIYDAKRDAFIPPKLFPSWVLDETTGLWKAPVDTDPALAKSVPLAWDEQTLSWKDQSKLSSVDSKKISDYNVVLKQDQITRTLTDLAATNP